MNGALLGGLAYGFASIADSMKEQQKADREEAQLRKKLEMTAALQKEILKAKQDYAQAHPEYKHFLSTASGDMVMFDEFGNSKRIEGTPEDKDIIQQKLDNDAAYKKARATEMAETLPARVGLLGAQEDAARARADKDRRPTAPKGKSSRPANMKTPAEMVAIKTGMAKDLFGADAISDQEYQDAVAAETSGKSSLYNKQTIQLYKAQQAKLAEQMAFYKPMTAQDADKYSTAPGLLAPQADAADEEAAAPEASMSTNPFDQFIPQ